MKQQLLVSKADKKKIMSLDLAERLIRVEQNVSACFNKPVSFTQTEYFKSMSNSEKKDFIKYLNNKTKKKVFKLFLVFLPLLIIFLLNMSITGKAIKETIGESYFIGAEILVVVLFVVLVIILIIKIISNKRRDKYFNQQVKVIDDILVKKSTVKNHKK